MELVDALGLGGVANPHLLQWRDIRERESRQNYYASVA